MEISDLEVGKGAFYVPTYAVKVADQDLLRDLCLAVSSVQVDLKQKAAGHFSFKVENAFDWETREFIAKPNEERIDLLELFAFGTPIEISFGYVDPSNLTVLLKGIITEISTGFSEGAAPELTVSGYDGLYPLTIGKNTQRWEQQGDSQVVNDIATAKGLSVDIVQSGSIYPSIDQNQESDLAFIQKLADRNGFTYYMRGDTLYFGPRQNERSDVVELGWGFGLLTFSPQVNLSKQITAVEVYGWSAEKGEQIVGRAARGDESGRDTRKQSGADQITRALGGEALMKIRASVHTQAEADARAKAILEERGEEFVKGNGTSIGIPEIVPDINLALTGLGSVFSKTYYVKSSQHQIDGNGYSNSFEIEETTI